MKRLIIVFAMVLAGTISIEAQTTVQSQLTEANNAYGSGNYEDARFALQQALVELDKLIGEAILNSLPTNLSGLTADTEQDEMTGGAAGITGVYVQRHYLGDGEQLIDLEVVTNSPIMAMVNASLTNPLLASMSGGSQSVVKIAGYKSLVEKMDRSDGTEQYEVKIPVNDSMILVRTEGFSQNETINIANTIDVRGIAKLVGSTQ